jgi:biphenyl-2,3-diol 1,2-dioxygenase
MTVQREIEIAYVGIEVPDPATLTDFFGDVIGLVPGAPGGDGVVTWRNDHKAQRVIVQPGPRGDAAFVGFEAVDDIVFDATVARLRSIGCDVSEEGDDELRDRRVRRLARTASPFGVDAELVVGLEDAATPFSSDLVPGGFLTEGVGFGHAVFATPEYDATERFLVDGMGLSQSDWIELEIAEGIVLEVHFFHCNARHHTVAVARAPFELPQTLHHIMFETNDRDDTGAAFDRVFATDLTVPNGLGRHDNDGMFSFYVESPEGFQVEVGHGARLITDDWDDNRCYDRISSWGHQPLRRG